MAQVEQNLLPTTIIQETQFHTDDAMSTQESTQEVVEHESDLVVPLTHPLYWRDPNL